MSFNRPLILASSSPRRQALMQSLGYSFSVLTSQEKEDYPPGMLKKSVAKHIAKVKAVSLKEHLSDNAVLLAADTVVILKDEILGKPHDRNDAITMLERLSGRVHTVVTGVCLLDSKKIQCFDDSTKVSFRALQQKEIIYYIDHFKPFDKAGGYGIQDWIGMIGIDRIKGSYFTVMGLPLHKVYRRLQQF